MSWGKGIAVSFVLFAVFIGILVILCVREDISLVSVNYYPEELVYQQQIDRLNNTAELKDVPTIGVTDKMLTIYFGELKTIEYATLKLFRPSDSRMDRQFLLQPSQGERMEYDLHLLPKGIYKAQLLWAMNGKEYFIEHIIML